VPSPTRCLTAGDASTIVRNRALSRPGRTPRVGVELEWLSHPINDPSTRVAPAAIAAALASVRLPNGSATTIEPGGQVELSSAPHATLDALLSAVTEDAALLRAALRRAGIDTVAAPIDHARPPERVVDSGRYRAMEAYFDAIGPDGRVMMCNTASMQVNVDAGGDTASAWRAANVAASVAGALGDGRRRDVWNAIDPTRCAPVVGDDVAEAWAAYALAARVMFIRAAGDDCVPVLDGMTLADWLTDGHALGWPTVDDVIEHLTTLFPPVRPRGFFEVRTIDVCDDADWPALASITAAVVLDGAAARDVADAGDDLTVDSLIAIARRALARLGVSSAVLAAVDAFEPEAARCP